MDETAGEWSARHELAKLDKFYAAGGQVDSVQSWYPYPKQIVPETRPIP